MPLMRLGGHGRSLGMTIAGLVLAGGIGGATAEQKQAAVTMDMFTTDGRAPLILSETEKNFVLWEMREMLVAVQGIVAGLSSDDMEHVSRAAIKMGSDAAELVPEETVARLPPQFREWANETHTEFDTISIAARSGETPDMIMFRLSGMLNTCVVCHATYRVEVE